MKMEQRKFRIGELARIINVKRFVIRFWEKEFSVNTERSDGKQRFYTQKDILLFTHIKSLLYERGFTIAGAKQEIKNFNASQTSSLEHTATTYTPSTVSKTKKHPSQNDFSQKLASLQKKLTQLRQLLS